MMARARRLTAALALVVVGLGTAHGVELRVDVGGSRSVGDPADQAVRTFARRTAKLAHKALVAEEGRTGRRVQLSLPVRVVLCRNGAPLASRARSGPAVAGIVPTFDASGSRSFPSDYKLYLESVFASAEPFLTAIFGSPAISGTVHVRNYDADIQDRYAVAGGYYVPNGPDGPEVRFPVYNNPVSAAVNYIHVLLLAYMGPNQYPWDAYNEGLVRAATIAVARQSGAIPLPGGYTQSDVEATLESLYDVGTHYDWYNQPALGGPAFIAPNLLNAALPPGGSTGGIFLLRHQMAGSAWYKTLVENPGFIAEYNRRFYANPSLYATTGALVGLGQDVLDYLKGTPGGTVEGRSFADWFARQCALDTRLCPGPKVLVHAFPMTPTVASDFGVFGIEANAFLVKPTGDEVLSSGVCYPLYWRPDGSRFFMTAQDDTIPISGAYGSVSPNFPSETYGGQPYRVAVDVPFLGRIERTYLPAGGFATGANPTPCNFYGTLVGYAYDAANPYSVKIAWSGGSATVPVKNLAFGTTIADATFLRPQKVTVTLYESVGGMPVERFSRPVNKGGGALAVDLRTPESEGALNLTLPARLSLIGMAADPLRPNAADALGMLDGETLVARWNPILGQYSLYPTEGSLRQGLGYFVRPASARTVSVPSKTSPKTSIAVALQPGWNMVTTPFKESTPTSRVQVTVAAESVSTWAEALGTSLGTAFFRFEPDPTDPEQGSLVEATSFEPGVGYFVRALRAEGAVLVFTPSGMTKGRSVAPAPLPGGPSTPAPLLGRPSAPFPGRFYLPQRRVSIAAPAAATVASSARVPYGLWEAQITLRQAGGNTCNVRFGQAMNASAGYDARIDSEMPPGPGGLQVVSLGASPLYRDIRPAGLTATYTLRMTGLKPGWRYVVTFGTLAGNRAYNYSDPEAGVERQVRGWGQYSFTAEGSQKDVTVRVGGAQ